MTKFNKGDKVRIIANLGYPREDDRFIGTEGIIEDFDYTGDILLNNREDPAQFWTTKELELIEDSEECTMEFKVGDEVKVVKVDTESCEDTYIATLGRTGKVSMIDSDDDMQIKVIFDEPYDYFYYNADELELAVKTVEFKAGDRVEVIDTHSLTLAKNGDKGTVKSVDDEGYLEVSFDNGGSCDAWQAKRFKVITDTPMSYRDALLHTLNGTMIVRHTSMKQGEYLVFNDSWYDNNGKPRIPDYLNDNTGNWEQYIVPTPPKFTIDSLVYNADGTIGKIVEDKGLFKGERCYSVRYNAVRDVAKHVKESELTAYVL